MCGINGLWNRDGSAVDRDQFIVMRDTMIHRGPDDEGAWFREDRGDLALGHRRLSIVDLTEAGRQPMANEDGSVQVTFNGEIYNHADLRPGLEAAGHTFRSRCDAEVLVHLWEEHGPAMVHDLIGMFAFAIWDERKQQLFVARDRMGVKPLYWFDDGRQFAFGSEIKALLPVMGKPAVDPVALADYLTFVSVPGPRTLFANARKLAPGCRMLVTRDGPQEAERYWDPLADRADFGDEAPNVDWSVEVMGRLRRSVERRMMSDVPVGVFLSGGVDSSTNAALVGETTTGPVRTFSIAFHDDDQHDELAWARRVADKFGTDHHETRIGAQDLWDFLPDLIFHQDEPIADPVCVPLYFVSKLAKDNGVTVVHVGEGADEIFAGYPTYVQAHQMWTTHWNRFRSLPRFAQRLAGRAGALALKGRPGYELHREALLRGAQLDGHLWWGGAVAFYPEGLKALTTDRFRRDIGEHAPGDIVADNERDATRFGARDELDRLIYQDLRLRLPELLLMRVDKLTMAASIEAREPFLDHELVELAMAIPADQKIQGDVGKMVLKRGVEPILDPEIVWRPKQGFGTPVSAWFRGQLGDILQRQLNESSVWDLDYLKRDKVTELLEMHRSGRAERSFQLWNILNLSMWHDHWVASA